MFIRLTDVVNENERYVNINHITFMQRMPTGETLIDFIGGCCYSNSTPEDLVLEIERIKNEENE